MSSMPVPIRAWRIKRGDVITVHPDKNTPVEYHVTADAREGEFGAWHIDYVDGAGKTGELVELNPNLRITAVPGGSGLVRLTKERKGDQS